MTRIVLALLLNSSTETRSPACLGVRYCMRVCSKSPTWWFQPLLYSEVAEFGCSGTLTCTGHFCDYLSHDGFTARAVACALRRRGQCAGVKIDPAGQRAPSTIAAVPGQFVSPRRPPAGQRCCHLLARQIVNR